MWVKSSPPLAELFREARGPQRPAVALRPLLPPQTHGAVCLRIFVPVVPSARSALPLRIHSTYFRYIFPQNSPLDYAPAPPRPRRGFISPFSALLFLLNTYD